MNGWVDAWLIGWLVAIMAAEASSEEKGAKARLVDSNLEGC